MLSDLFDQIFGRSKCGKREIITTSIVEPDSCDDFTLANDSNATRICFLPSTFLLSDGSEINNDDDDDGDGHGNAANKLISNDDDGGEGSNDDDADADTQPQHKRKSTTIDQRSAILQQQSHQQQWRPPSLLQGKINTTLHNQNQCLTNQYPQHHHFHHPHQSQPNRNRMHPHQQKKLNELSIFSVYLLFITLFMCCCTIAALLFTYINRANDIMQLRDSLTSEFIVRNDIDALIRNVLREMKSGAYMDDSDGNRNGDGDDAENIYTDLFGRDDDGHRRNSNNNNKNNKNNHIEASNQNELR